MTDQTPSQGHRAVAASSTGNAHGSNEGADGPTGPSRGSGASDTAATATTSTARQDDVAPRRDDREVLRREKAEFGGMRFFLAFFGWLTATGAVVLLTALVTGVLALIGVQNQTASASNPSTQQTAGIVGIVVLAIVLFIGYYIGGYVAGRMARFSGLKQGLAVWLWAVIIAVVVAIIGAISANNAGAFSQLNSTGLPISGATAATAGIASLIVAVVFSLVGALLGGIGGMRFHRKVDRFARQQA